MKRNGLIYPLALALTLLLAASAQAAPRGGGGGGGHGGGHGGGGHGGGGHGGHGGHGHGGGTVVIGGGWGWGWGGYWGYPGYYGYPYGYAGYGYGGGPGGYGWGVIDTDIAPEEAVVFLDGKPIGTADDFDGYPDYLYLGPGHYKIEFRLDGYEPVVKDVDVQPGMYIDFTDKMAGIPGVKPNPANNPRFEGDIQRYFMKRRGGRNGGGSMPAPNGDYGNGGYGNYGVEGGRAPGDGNDGYDQPAPQPPQQQPSRQPQPRDDQWRGNRYERVQARTRLHLTVQPEDAAVYVDNRFVGTAEEVNSIDRGVTITPGHHVVTVSRPGFREKSVEVTVDEGKAGNLEISLTK